MAKTALPPGTTIVNGNLVIPVGNNDIATGNLKIRVKAVAGVNNTGAELLSNAPFTYAAGNTTPAAPTFTAFDDTANTVTLVPAPGVPMADYRYLLPNNSTVYTVPANGVISVGDISGSVTAYSIAVAGRNQSPNGISPAFTVTQATAPYVVSAQITGPEYVEVFFDQGMSATLAGWTFWYSVDGVTWITIAPSGFFGGTVTAHVFGFTGHNFAGQMVRVSYDPATGNTVSLASGIELTILKPDPFPAQNPLNTTHFLDHFIDNAGTDLLDHIPDAGGKWAVARGDYALDGSPDGMVYPLVSMAGAFNTLGSGYNDLRVKIAAQASGQNVPVYYRYIDGGNFIYVQYNRNPLVGDPGTLNVVQVLNNADSLLGSLQIGDYGNYTLFVNHSGTTLRTWLNSGTGDTATLTVTTGVAHSNAAKFGFQLPTGVKIDRVEAKTVTV